MPCWLCFYTDASGYVCISCSNGTTLWMFVFHTHSRCSGCCCFACSLPLPHLQKVDSSQCLPLPQPPEAALPHQHQAQRIRAIAYRAPSCVLILLIPQFPWTDCGRVQRDRAAPPGAAGKGAQGMMRLMGMLGTMGVPAVIATIPSVGALAGTAVERRAGMVDTETGRNRSQRSRTAQVSAFLAA